GPLGGAEAVAEGLVLPRTDDVLDRHASLLSRTRESPWRSRVHLPPLLVAPDAGGGHGPASGIGSSVRCGRRAPGRGILERAPSRQGDVLSPDGGVVAAAVAAAPAGARAPSRWAPGLRSAVAGRPSGRRTARRDPEG